MVFPESRLGFVNAERAGVADRESVLIAREPLVARSNWCLNSRRLAAWMTESSPSSFSAASRASRNGAQVVEAEGEMKYQTHDLGSWLESSTHQLASKLSEEVIR